MSSSAWDGRLVSEREWDVEINDDDDEQETIKNFDKFTAEESSRELLAELLECHLSNVPFSARRFATVCYWAMKAGGNKQQNLLNTCGYEFLNTYMYKVYTKRMLPTASNMLCFMYVCVMLYVLCYATFCVCFCFCYVGVLLMFVAWFCFCYVGVMLVICYVGVFLRWCLLCWCRFCLLVVCYAGVMFLFLFCLCYVGVLLSSYW